MVRSGAGELQRIVGLDEEIPEEQIPFTADTDSSHFAKQMQQRQFRKALTGGVLAVATLLFLAGLFATQAASGPMRRVVSKQSGAQWQMAAEETGKCHTAVQSEHCHSDVQWAMTKGISDHPEFYEESCPRLLPTSRFEDFQACIYRINKTSCPLPCNNEADHTKIQEAAQTIMKKTPSLMPQGLAHKKTANCHIVKQGACYDKVIEVMAKSYDEDPDRYPGISKKSTFEEVQAKLHDDLDICSRPCKCLTATKENEGKKCFGHVDWAMREGIRAHPAWYDGLTVSSSFEEIQGYLHRDDKGTCQLPCSGVTWDNAKDNVGAEISASVSCNEVAWPDKHLVCGKCKALIARMDTHYEHCGRFCQEIGRKCEGAWMEQGDGCDPGETVNCDQKIDAPLGICQCGEMLPASELAKLVKDQPPPLEKETEAENCHNAPEDSKCHEAIHYGMTKGLFENPQWYEGLDQFSSAEDFQKVLLENKDLKCPTPCRCKTSKMGEECYKNLQWVIKEGVKVHPDWYPGIDGTSRWEKVQARLHEDPDSPCEKPCSEKPWGNPSLFCVGIFRSQGYELDLVRAQVEKGVGIFGCDEYAVLSDKVLEVTKVVKTLLVPPCETVGVSKDGTAANTLIFMQMWSVIYDDVRYKAHDWIIKADPDAVVFPDRIRAHLKPHTGQNVWITNCMKYTGPGWPMMFGSLEAFSVQAMETYYEGADRCRTELEWQAWGEDLFMGNCLSLLGAQSVFDGGLIGDEVCKGGNCADGVTAAYHPYKDAGSWFQCYNQAMGI